VVGATGKINYKAIFNQFYKNGYQDWFVELEDKMTKEQRVQSMAMMENMKKIQAQGGSMKDVMDQLAKNQPMGDKGAAPSGSQDPKAVAEQLKISLEGIKESADYLLKSDFVK
jgi:hypothetical protein